MKVLTALFLSFLFALVPAQAQQLQFYPAPGLPLQGGTMLGSINMGAFRITNMGDPAGAQDAATRGWVLSNLLGPTLTSGHIFVGNGSNVATDVAMSADGSMSNTGALTVTKTNGVAFAASATTDTTNASNIGTGAMSPNRIALTNGKIIVGNGANVGAESSLSAAGVQTNSLTNSHFWVGNGSNVAADVAASGDVSLANTGAVTVNKIGGQFVSSQQTITSGGTLTLAHGLGRTPTMVYCHLVCGTAENGYSINDRTLKFPNSAVDVLGDGYTVVPDGTNLNVTFGSSGMGVLNKSTGARVLITNANWTAVFYAF